MIIRYSLWLHAVQWWFKVHARNFANADIDSRHLLFHFLRFWLSLSLNKQSTVSIPLIRHPAFVISKVSVCMVYFKASTLPCPTPANLNQRYHYLSWIMWAIILLWLKLYYVSYEFIRESDLIFCKKFQFV